MTDKGLLCTGAAGSVIAAICCFTPALVLLLGAVGLSAWLAWLDYVLLPALILFLGITVYALIRKQRAKAGQTRPTEAR
jgi:mercuric ion transport protein